MGEPIQSGEDQPLANASIPVEKLGGIIGQERLVSRLKAFARFYQEKGTTPGHVLLLGDDGKGRATVASAFAGEMACVFQSVVAESLQIRGDMTALLTNLQEKQVLLLRNAHLLKRNLVAVLRSALHDQRLDLVIGLGNSARQVIIDIHSFTLVATCPRRPDCPQELLREFALTLNMEPYTKTELTSIAGTIAGNAGVSIERGVAELVAKCCDGRPGNVGSIFQRLIKAVNKNQVTVDEAEQALRAFGLYATVHSPRGAAGGLDSMSGVDFERCIVTLLGQMGFQAKMTKASGDGGIDIDATLDKPIVGGRYLFQCKRFAPENLVGAPMLRDFYGAVTADRAVKGVFVTTSDFTAQAREFGERVGLELINLADLQKLFTECGISDASQSAAVPGVQDSGALFPQE